MNEPVIKVENFDVIFDKGTPRETYALKNINIEINKGEYVSHYHSNLSKAGSISNISELLLNTISNINKTKPMSGVEASDQFFQNHIPISKETDDLSKTISDELKIPLGWLSFGKNRSDNKKV